MRASAAEVRAIIVKHASRKSEVHTDESPIYTKLGSEFTAHKTVVHSKNEYVRDDVHTNSIESHWSVFKRGMSGVYQHCVEKHLHRYLVEFDFRNNHRSKLGIGDIERTFAALKGAEGKRLIYRHPN